MTFWEHFFRLLPRRPVPALAALYWHLTRRRLRARNRLLAASANQPFAYDIWIQRIERNRELAPTFRQAVQSWHWKPEFCVVLYGRRGATEEQARSSRDSIEQQIYPHWTLIECEIESANSGWAEQAFDYMVPLRIGDILAENALFRFAEALQTSQGISIMYGDEDRLDRRGRRILPWFKPRWNEELFFAQDYLCRAVAIEAGLARQVGDQRRFNNLSDFMLVTTSLAAGPIIHIPHIVCHVAAKDSEDCDTARLEAVAGHLQQVGARCSLGPFGTVKVQWPLPDELPLVSIIIPTKDKLELLRPCLESVLARTDYDNFEVVIVDNGSVEERTAKFLFQAQEDPKVRVLAYPHPYNFSAINNFAVSEARGSHICLLNNDTEVLTSSWLSELMRYAVRPDVGAVGAKLLYEDGSIQHAGVVVGIGEAAGHAHRFLPAEKPGYFRMAHVSQFVSAVTAACLVVEKRKFLSVGGLDEESLAIAFNDVDLCMKLQAAGWRNVYVAHAVLKHYESKSRGDDMAPAHFQRYLRELKVLQQRWETRTYQDPLFNPNLARSSETFALRL